MYVPMYIRWLNFVENTSLLLLESTCTNSKAGANLTIVSQNANVVKIYSTTGRLVRFVNKKYFLLL
jgi:hypothetical protein